MPRSEWETWKAREDRKEKMALAGAWALFIFGTIGMVVAIWAVCVIVFGSAPA